MIIYKEGHGLYKVPKQDKDTGNLQILLHLR